MPRQRLCRARNQGGGGAGTSADRTSRSAWRASRRPAAVVLGSLRFLGRERMAFNGDVMRDLAAQFLALAEKQDDDRSAHDRASFRGHFLTVHGRHRGRHEHISIGRSHFTILLEHRSWRRDLARTLAVCNLVLSVDRAVVAWLSRRRARGRGARASAMPARSAKPPALMFALSLRIVDPYPICGNYAAANAQMRRAWSLGGRKGRSFWKASGMTEPRLRFWLMTGKASDAVADESPPGSPALRSTGATMWMPMFLTYLARAHAELGQFDDAWRCIGEAMTAVETTKERWCEARSIAWPAKSSLRSPEPDLAKA